MRLVKLTDLDGDDLIHANGHWLQQHPSGGTMILVRNGLTLYAKGTPAEVARLLAGEGDDPNTLAGYLRTVLGLQSDVDGQEIVNAVRSVLDQRSTAWSNFKDLTAEVERLKALIEHNSTLSTGWLETLKAERDEARAVLNEAPQKALDAIHQAYDDWGAEECPWPERGSEDETSLWVAIADELGVLNSASASPAPEPEPDDRRALLETALRALVITHQYAPQTLRPLPGWEWYDAAVKLAAAVPGSEWAAAVPEPAGEAEEADEPEAGTVIGFDEGTPGGDHTARVEGEVQPDGSVVVTDVKITPAGEAGEKGTDDPGQGDSGQATDQPDSRPEPAPATPTTGLLSYAPRSTSGIGISFAGSVLPLTRTSEGEFLPGCSYVLYTNDQVEIYLRVDPRATDGPAPGTIRWRVNNGGDPFEDDRASSSKAALLKADTVVRGAPTWPEASGPISVVDLGPPLTDADGSRWWRVEAWSDVSATANKSEASDRATVFFVCVLAPGVEAPRPPAVGYHASDPIVVGSPIVHPITFVTDADPSPGAGESPEPLLFRDNAHLADILANADPGVKATALALYRDGFQSKRSGPYVVDRTAGHWLTLRNQQPQYSAMCTAVRILTGEATDEDRAFLRLYALNNGLSAPEIAIGEHGDRTALWGGFSYYAAFEETFSVACVYSWGRRFNLWTSSEEARIRDQLARFCWTSLQLHRNPYRKWINANGSTQAMWESARDWVSGLVALVMPLYDSPQYGFTADWRGYFVLGLSHFDATQSRSGLYGLLSDEPRWNDDGGRYFKSHLCAGPLALTLACLANAGETVPAYYEDALILALDGKLPGAEGVNFWSPLLVKDAFPKYRAAVLAKHGKAAVVAAQTHISTGNNDYAPGGLGAGTAVLGLLLTEVTP